MSIKFLVLGGGGGILGFGGGGECRFYFIAIASDFRVDGAKSPEIPQKEGVLGSEIAARNRKSLATFHRTLKSQCSIAFSCLGNRAISGVRDGHRNRKSQKSLRFRRCPTECPRGHAAHAPECPRSVPRVRPKVWDTLLTLRRHSRDTFWTLRSPRPEGPQKHPVGHSVGDPRFRGHSRGHPPGHSGPKGPRDPCSWSAGSQFQKAEETGCYCET